VDSIAELHLWRDWFGMTVRNQPHPSLSNDMEIWLANTWARGWHPDSRRRRPDHR
jgi:hypothetical protein